MISRRPKRRASTDQAPGPNRTTVAATTATKIVIRIVCGSVGVGNGNHEKAMPVAPSAISPPAIGVRNPARRQAPPISAGAPKTDEPVLATPPRIAAIATAERSSRRPRPRLPPGYVLDNSLVLPVLRVVSIVGRCRAGRRSQPPACGRWPLIFP